jgi:hypothetical protein
MRTLSATVAVGVSTTNGTRNGSMRLLHVAKADATGNCADRVLTGTVTANVGNAGIAPVGNVFLIMRNDSMADVTVVTTAH